MKFLSDYNHTNTSFILPASIIFKGLPFGFL